MDETESRRPFVISAVVATHEGRVLLLKKPDPPDFDPATMYPGSWCLPGGKVEYGESPEVAASRELREETGLDLLPRDFRFSGVTNVVTPLMHMVGLVYRVDVPAGKVRWAQNLERTKHESMEWFSWGSLPSPLMPGLQQWLAARLGA